MTAFADLLDLRTAVVEQIGRTDIADIFPQVVKLAEAYLNRNLRMADQVTETTLTFASGVASLPTDYAAMIGLYNASGAEYVQQTHQTAYQDRCYYTVDGSDVKIFGFEGDLTAQYYAKLPTIADSMTDSNWLLQKYPSVYLYAVAFEAAKWKRDREMASDMGGLRDEAISDAMGDDASARYSRARVRVRGVTP